MQDLSEIQSNTSRQSLSTLDHHENVGISAHIDVVFHKGGVKFHLMPRLLHIRFQTTLENGHGCNQCQEQWPHC